MKTVNPFFLHEILSPITGLADDDFEVQKYMSLDPNNVEQVKNIINCELKPSFERLDNKAKEQAKFALRYYLSKSSSDFVRVFESCLPPFDPPDDARKFFVWVWEEFFPGENFELQDLAGIKEVPDIHEPSRY